MGSGEGCEKGGFRNFWYKAGSATGSAKSFQRLASQRISEKKKKTARLWAKPPKLIFFFKIYSLNNYILFY
jgi:hypothetical protein